jgi:hypothetical protein
MNERGVFATWARLTVATLVGIPVALAGLGTVGGGVASATTTLVPQTAFAIDGNSAGPNDFDAPYGPGTTPGGFPTTGLYVSRRNTDTATDPVACGSPDDAAVGGTKLEDGPNWPVGGPVPNGKTDLDSLYLATEKVNVSGQINDILYVGYLTCDDGPGTWQTALYVDDGDNVSPGAGDLNGDYLFIFDFNPSTGAATTFMYRKVSGVWTNQPFAVGQIEGIAGAGGDFGEVAINLTALDIVDAATCRNVILQGQGASITGGSLTSAVKDLILVPPLPISNCGSVTVTKSSNPAGIASADAFHYVIDQADAATPGEPGTVHDATLTVGGVAAPGSTTEPDANVKEIDATIGVGQTQTWTNVISQPDYRIVEDSIPAGWRLERIDCTYTDIFVSPPASKTVTIYENGAPTSNRFLVAPSTFAGTALPATACTIVNATSGVVVAKAGSGNPATDFPFTVATGAITVASPTLGLGESSPVVAVTPGSSVTITESLPASNPAWTLQSIACVASTSGPVTPTATTATSVTFATLPGQVVTCTFTNRQSGRITVAKTGAGDAAADFGFDTDYVAGAGADFTLSLGESNTSANLAPGAYQVSELLAAANATLDPDFAGSVSCATTTTGSGTSSSSTTSLTANITLGAGDIVTCTYSNTQDGRIVVAKNTVNGDASFDFTGSVTGSITTVGGTGTTTLSDDVAPGTYGVAETPTPGYTLTSSVCSDGSAVGAIGVAAGETVTCTFINTRNQGTFVLRKVWGDGSNPGSAVDLSATVSGPAPVSGGIATTSTSPTTTTSTPITVYSGQTVDFAEAFTTADGTAYNSAVSCTGGGTPSVNADNRSGSVAVGNTPGAVICTITNTPKVTGIALQKNWAANANTGDIAALTAVNGLTSNAASSLAPAAPSFLGAANTTDNTAFVSVVAGDTVTFSENLGAATANYTSTFDCPTATNDPVAGPNGTWTLAVAAADVANGDTIFCSVTNTRREVDLVLVKDWNAAKVGDAVTITATGSDTTPISLSSTVATADETDTSLSFTVYAGETLDLGEVFTAGDAAAYATTFDCTGNASPEQGQTVTVSPADTAITCTFVNTRRSVDVLVAKDLAPTTDPGRFDLAVNGNVVVPGAGDGDASAPVPVLVGDLVTLAETAAIGSLANYTSTLACNNGVTVGGNTGTRGSFEVPSSLATGTDVVCTFTNTRKQTDLTVVKSWGTSPVDGEQVSLTITGGLATASDGSSTNDDTANDTAATSVVYAGEAVSVTEAFVVGAAANFDTTLVCIDGSPQPLVDTAGALTGGFTVGTSPTTITCTFTNERKSTPLTVRKFWQNARVGDAATLSATSALPPAATSTSSATSTATTANLLDETNVATRTVYAGETIDLAETLSAPALYNTSLTCGTDQLPLTNRSAQITIPSNPAGAIGCTFTNTRKSTSFQLAKQWVGATALDVANLSITSITPATPAGAVAPAGDGVSPQVAAATVYAGESISVSEAFAPGNTGSYVSTSFDCLGTATPAVARGTTTVPLTISAADVDAANATNTPIVCRFTNTARGAVTVDKTASPTITRSGATHTASYTLTVASESFVDETFSLSDTPGFAANATITSVVATGPGLPVGGVVVPNAGGAIVTDGTIPARAGQLGGPAALVYTVTVTFTLAPSATGQACSGQPANGGFNSATVTVGAATDTSNACIDLPAPNVELTKTVASATRNADGTWTVVYTLTVTNDGAVVAPALYMLTDTVAFGANVTVNAPIVVAPPVPGFTGVAPDNVVATDATIGAGETHVYTVTANVSIDPFGANGSCTTGGGLRNDASVTLIGSEAPLTASACAPYSTLTLTKLAPNDNGANLPASAFTLTATQNGTTIISGPTPAASAVVAGSYVLDESPRLPGYATGAYVCTGGQITGDTVVVPVGANVICTITNDDQPVDLQLTKDDGGFQAVAGGAPIPYRLVVTNVGLRNVDAGEPVTVTDVLPDGLVWGAPVPAGCSVSGQVLTCTIPGDDVQVGDAPYVIDLVAQVTLDAPSGTVTNLAFVTTQDDPACVGANCVPVCPPSSNNVDCEDTPVDSAADLQIVKSAGAPLIGAGGGFDWVLDVTNNGPGRAVSVVVSDTVPASLTVTGVTSTQFTCTAAGNAVTCTRPAMQPGETGRITISVVVPTTAAGGSITNTGSATASTPETNLTNNVDDAVIQIVEQAAPTTTVAPVVGLPATGSNATIELVRAALLLLGLGGGLLLLARRRRVGSTA